MRKIIVVAYLGMVGMMLTFVVVNYPALSWPRSLVDVSTVEDLEAFKEQAAQRIAKQAEEISVLNDDLKAYKELTQLKLAEMEKMKANRSDVYNKDEISEKLDQVNDTKANKENVHAKEALNSKLLLTGYSKAGVNRMLDSKSRKVAVHSTNDVDSKLNKKADNFKCRSWCQRGGRSEDVNTAVVARGVLHGRIQRRFLGRLVVRDQG